MTSNVKKFLASLLILSQLFCFASPVSASPALDFFTIHTPQTSATFLTPGFRKVLPPEARDPAFEDARRNLENNPLGGDAEDHVFDYDRWADDINDTLASGYGDHYDPVEPGADSWQSLLTDLSFGGLIGMGAGAAQNVARGASSASTGIGNYFNFDYLNGDSSSAGVFGGIADSFDSLINRGVASSYNAYLGLTGNKYLAGTLNAGNFIAGETAKGFADVLRLGEGLGIASVAFGDAVRGGEFKNLALNAWDAFKSGGNPFLGAFGTNTRNLNTALAAVGSDGLRLASIIPGVRAAFSGAKMGATALGSYADDVGISLSRLGLAGQRGSIPVGGVVKSSNVLDLYHSAKPNNVQSILKNGFDLNYGGAQEAFHRNRLGAAAYFADSPQSALVERVGAILKARVDLGRNLNIMDRIIDPENKALWHSIARGARKHGYDSITYQSVQKSGGINTAVFDPKRIQSLRRARWYDYLW